MNIATVSFIFAGVLLLFLVSFKWAKVSSEKEMKKFIKQQKEREMNQER